MLFTLVQSFPIMCFKHGLTKHSILHCLSFHSSSGNVWCWCLVLLCIVMTHVVDYKKGTWRQTCNQFFKRAVKPVPSVNSNNFPCLRMKLFHTKSTAQNQCSLHIDKNISKSFSGHNTDSCTLSLPVTSPLVQSD